MDFQLEILFLSNSLHTSAEFFEYFSDFLCKLYGHFQEYFLDFQY